MPPSKKKKSSSSKKKKGGGKRAAADAAYASAYAAASSSTTRSSFDRRFTKELNRAFGKKLVFSNKLLESEPPAEIVKRIKNGSMVPPDGDILSKKGNLQLRQKLLDAGLISAIVSFLNQGAHKEFHIVIDESTLKCLGMTKEGGVEQISPKFWLQALTFCTDPDFPNSEDIRVQIALEFTPFLGSMCDDITREYFQSNAYYHGSLGLFFYLIKTTMGYEDGKTSASAGIILEHDGFFDMVVQCLFWRTHRPDIVREFTLYDTLDHLEYIEADAKLIIDLFMLHYISNVHAAGGKHERDVYNNDRVLDFFKRLATTPIVSIAYEPNNEDIFLSNVATLMATDSFYELSEDYQEWYFDVLLKSCWAGLIDKRVITSVIDLFASVRTCSVAVRVIEMTFNLLCKRTGVWISESQPYVAEDDDRFAAAINAGMTEACLAMLKRFAGQRKYTELILNIDNLLDSVNIVKAKKRSARAIKSNRKSIERALKTSEEVLTGAKEKTILNLVSNILFIADYCRQCEKILEKEDILCCSRCKVAKYCGKDCQVKHWRSHKVFCHAAVMNAKQIKSNGGSDADILLQNAQDYFKNRGLEVANKNSATITFMAISKGYNILDCVADVDLAVSPPSIEVLLAADFLAQDPVGSSKSGVTKEMVKDAQKLKKGIIEEAQQNKCLPVNIVGYEFGVQLGMVQLLPVPMSFARPGYLSFFGRTWPELEKRLRKMFCGGRKMDKIKHMVDAIPGFLDKMEKVVAYGYGTFEMEEGNESDESEEEIASLIKVMLNESDESQEEIISLIEEMANINLDELREENVTEKVSSAPAPAPAAAAASDVTVKENKDEEMTVDDDEKEEAAKSSPIASGRKVAETPAAKVDDSNEAGSKPATLSINGDSKPAAAPVAHPVANVAASASKPPPTQPQPTLLAAAAANPFNPAGKELKVEDAQLYLDQVKLEFGDRPHIYNQFLEILKSFKAREVDTVDTIGVINSVRKLFHGYNNLILGFNIFLPEGYTIEMRDSECSYE